MHAAINKNERGRFLEIAEFRGSVLVNKVCSRGASRKRADEHGRVLSSVTFLDQGKEKPKEAEGRNLTGMLLLPNSVERPGAEVAEQLRQRPCTNHDDRDRKKVDWTYDSIFKSTKLMPHNLLWGYSREFWMEDFLELSYKIEQFLLLIMVHEMAPHSSYLTPDSK